MKLFDRSVDLAQFNENSSLYSIARAWISNKSQQEERPRSPDMTQQQPQEEVINSKALVVCSLFCLFWRSKLQS